ncbi:MAG: hypothetical protein AAFY15_06880, partial [Cyanobacteria bacterium J06648_11]
MPFSDDIPVARRQSVETRQSRGGSWRGLGWLGGGAFVAIAIAAVWLARPAISTRVTPANAVDVSEPVVDDPPVDETGETIAVAESSVAETAAILGHFAFDEASPEQLVVIEGDLRLHENAARKYREMLAAARQDG